MNPLKRQQYTFKLDDLSKYYTKSKKLNKNILFLGLKIDSIECLNIKNKYLDDELINEIGLHKLKVNKESFHIPWDYLIKKINNKDILESTLENLLDNFNEKIDIDDVKNQNIISFFGSVLQSVRQIGFKFAMIVGLIGGIIGLSLSADLKAVSQILLIIILGFVLINALQDYFINTPIKNIEDKISKIKDMINERLAKYKTQLKEELADNQKQLSNLTAKVKLNLDRCKSQNTDLDNKCETSRRQWSTEMALVGLINKTESKESNSNKRNLKSTYQQAESKIKKKIKQKSVALLDQNKSDITKFDRSVKNITKEALIQLEYSDKQNDIDQIVESIVNKAFADLKKIEEDKKLNQIESHDFSFYKKQISEKVDALINNYYISEFSSEQSISQRVENLDNLNMISSRISRKFLKLFELEWSSRNSNQSVIDEKATIIFKEIKNKFIEYINKQKKIQDLKDKRLVNKL